MNPLHLDGNILCAIDIETTGLTAGFHEIIQIGIVPANEWLEPHTTYKPFSMFVRPDHRDRVSEVALAVNGLTLADLEVAPTLATVIERLDEYVASFQLPNGKGLIPLAHNWAFESSFLSAWIGIEHFQQMFARRARDTMTFAASLNDRCELLGRPPLFNGLSLGDLTKHYGIVNLHAHDAVADATVTLPLYRHLLLEGTVQWQAHSIGSVNSLMPSPSLSLAV